MTDKKVDILSKIDNHLHACSLCDILLFFACTINAYTISIACFFSQDQQKTRKKYKRWLSFQWSTVCYLPKTHDQFFMGFCQMSQCSFILLFSQLFSQSKNPKQKVMNWLTMRFLFVQNQNVLNFLFRLTNLSVDV